MPQSKPYQGCSLDDRDPKTIQSLMPFYDWVYRYYFRVKTSGWHHVPTDKPVLFVGSHNGGIAAPDMHMLMYDWWRHFGTEKPVYGLMHPKAWQVFPHITTMAAKLGAVKAHPKMAIAAFRRQASVLVYPGGAYDAFRPYRLRDRIYFADHKGFIKLALREEIPIVPLISWGAHDTLFILEDCYEQVHQLHKWGLPWAMDIDPEVFPIYLGLPWGLSFGALPNIPLPAQIHTRVCPMITFERYGRDVLADSAYIDSCYTTVVTQMQSALDALISELS
ncbi:MAG: lysophospholipid acyltransferase family protein [Cyanobacteria bacterium P01_A01_bin.37]